MADKLFPCCEHCIDCIDEDMHTIPCNETPFTSDNVQCQTYADEIKESGSA